jgi:RNA polymerase sigma-70 factor (ECF subfamily)
LEKLFASGVASLSDGNGAHQVARRPVVGASRVARFLATIADWFWTGLDVRQVTANGQTSAELSRDGTLFGLVTVAGSAEGIDQVLWIVNPDKLTGWR